MREAIAFLHGGGISELSMARALCFRARDSYGMAKDSSPPAAFHYDRWLGPAPLRPHNEKRSHYNWHWYWDTGNTGPHQLDIARWGLEKNEHPVAVYSTGGIFGFAQGEGKTPGTMVYGGVETYGHDKTAQETPKTQLTTRFEPTADRPGRNDLVDAALSGRSRLPRRAVVIPVLAHSTSSGPSRRAATTLARRRAASPLFA